MSTLLLSLSVSFSFHTFIPNRELDLLQSRTGRIEIQRIVEWIFQSIVPHWVQGLCCYLCPLIFVIIKIELLILSLLPFSSHSPLSTLHSPLSTPHSLLSPLSSLSLLSSLFPLFPSLSLLSLPSPPLLFLPSSPSSPLPSTS